MQRTNKPYDGFFLTIEGGEGSGKSTLAEGLRETLEKKGYSVFKTREPGGSPLSEHIRDLLLDSEKEFSIGQRAELFLFLAARAQHLEEKILPALHEGKLVICERFNDSTIAYQGGARHLGMHYVESLCKCASEGFADPDYTLFLDIDPEVGLHRVEKKRKTAFDRIEQEKLQFHKEVRQAYLHLADQYPERIIILDASQPKDQVLFSALQSIEPYLTLKPSQ